MPAKLERCVKKVQATGKPKDSSYAICQSSLKKGAKKRSKK
jgi:hypothetical protein